MTDMRDAVREAIENAYLTIQDWRDPAADAAITTILTMLAKEASQLEIIIRSPDGDWSDVGSWILFHMPSQPEVMT